jgi:hypothetical protein
LYLAVVFAIATDALAVKVKLVLLAMAFIIPTLDPVVLPIHAPTFNCVVKNVATPVTVALLVLHVTLPVTATLGKLVVYCIPTLPVAILILSVAIFADADGDVLFAVYAYDAILKIPYVIFIKIRRL